MEGKSPGREADSSTPSTSEVKNAGTYTSTTPHVLMVLYLLELRDNFTYLVLLYFTDPISKNAHRMSTEPLFSFFTKGNTSTHPL